MKEPINDISKAAIQRLVRLKWAIDRFCTEEAHFDTDSYQALRTALDQAYYCVNKLLGEQT